MKRFFAFLVVAVSILTTVVSQAAEVSAIKPALRIVSLGDSYTAGNAAGDYFSDPVCFRSHSNYSEVYGRMQSESWDFKYQNMACSSAVTSDIPNQIASDPSRVKNADIIFLSIGGNDGDFESVVRACLLTPGATGDSCVRLINQKWLEVNSVITDISSSLKHVSAAAKSSAEIVLVGYPNIVGDCGLSFAYTSPVTGGLANYDVSFELRGLQSFMDGKTKEMINSLRGEGFPVQFVSLRDLYEGHEICGAKDDWIAGPSSPIPESYHPNKSGHAATARLLNTLDILPEIQKPADPVYTTPPPATGTGAYAGLPFDCGTVVPFVSTYDNYGGVNHGYSLDMPMPQGTRVTSPSDGQVFTHNDPNGYGYFMDLAASDGVVHRFAHLSKFNVSHGQNVKRGQVIGYVGSTGFSTGPHLHYEQRKGSSQVPINLGGPALQWNGNQDSSGFRTTSHGLVSGNCTGTTWSSGSGASGGGISDRFADIFTFEYGHMRYGRSDGHDYRNWEIGLPNISKPTDSDTCDFDGDGWDEYLSYEKLSGSISRVMMADPVGDGRFKWSKIANVHSHVDKISCGDWNRDGRDDLIFHNTKGEIVYGRSNGIKVDGWSIILRGIGKPTFWDMCDINGDGKVDIVSYEKWGNQIMYGTRKVANATASSWGYLLKGIYGVGALTCNNFQNYSGDELVVWQPEDRGHYRIGVFNRYYKLIHWDALSPRGIGKPYNGELVSGDIDGDGYAEFVSNEYRSSRGDHSVMVGDFTSARTRTFRWHPFIEGIKPRNLGVGMFIG